LLLGDRAWCTGLRKEVEGVIAELGKDFDNQYSASLANFHAVDAKLLSSGSFAGRGPRRNWCRAAIGVVIEHRLPQALGGMDRMPARQFARRRPDPGDPSPGSSIELGR